MKFPNATDFANDGKMKCSVDGKEREREMKGVIVSESLLRNGDKVKFKILRVLPIC